SRSIPPTPTPTLFPYTTLFRSERQGPGTPVRVHPADFEVHRTELRTQAATVVMLDMSRSMLNNGYFLPAKKVILALSSLIRGQLDRKSTRLNSSHVAISYAVFC